MAGWQRSESILDTLQTIGASQTDVRVSKNDRPVTEGGRERCRFDFYIGAATVSAGVTLKIQDSSGYNIYTDNKTNATLATKSTTTFTAATTDIITAAGHGLSSGDVLTVATSGTLPAGLATDTRYWVEVIDANTFYLHTSAQRTNANRVDVTDTGSGTHNFTRVTLLSISYNPEVAGDQSFLPLRNLCRAVITTGAGDSVHIVDVVHIQPD